MGRCFGSQYHDLYRQNKYRYTMSGFIAVVPKLQKSIITLAEGEKIDFYTTFKVNGLKKIQTYYLESAF
jgi:hypothetical protein